MYNLIIVDDETLIRNSLVRTVDWESLGVHMAAALNDGEEAVRYMKEHPVDLVLSDIRMPFMDGIELLNYISVNYPSTRVILLTGYAEFDYVKQAMRSRVFDYLLKPLKQEELEETVLRCLESIKEENRIQKLVVQKSRENRQECLRRCLLGVGSGEEKEDLFAGVGHEFWLRNGDIVFDNRRGGHDGTISVTREQCFAKEQPVSGEPPYFGFADRTGRVYKTVEMPYYCNHYIATGDGKLFAGDNVEDIVLIRPGEEGSEPEIQVLASHNTTWKYQRSHCHPTFSWDGKKILYAADTDDTHCNLFLVDVE